MTLSPWIIYLWGIADQLQAFAKTSATLLLIALVLSIMASTYPDGDDAFRGVCYKWAKRFGVGLVFTALASVFTPSSNTVAVMVVAPAIVNSEPIQKDLPELYKAAKEALMKTLTEK